MRANIRVQKLNILYIYNIIKALESNKGESFFNFYTFHKNNYCFFKYLADDNVISYELLGKFIDLYGLEFSCITKITDKLNEFSNFLDMKIIENFFKEYSSIDERIVHDLCLFLYSKYIILNSDYEQSYLLKLFDSIFGEEEKTIEIKPIPQDVFNIQKIELADRNVEIIEALKDIYQDDEQAIELINKLN